MTAYECYVAFWNRQMTTNERKQLAGRVDARHSRQGRKRSGLIWSTSAGCPTGDNWVAPH